MNTINNLNNNQCSNNSIDKCLYRLPCGICMILKTKCIAITDTQTQFNKVDTNVNVEIPSLNFDIPNACKHCPNHPSNGGSGICNCILGSMYNVTC